MKKGSFSSIGEVYSSWGIRALPGIGMLRGKSIFFYSRRIGKAPQGYFPDERYTDFPAQTTILAAAKIIRNDQWWLGYWDHKRPHLPEAC